MNQFHHQNRYEVEFVLLQLGVVQAFQLMQLEIVYCIFQGNNSKYNHQLPKFWKHVHML